MNPEFSAPKMSISLDARVLPAVSFAMQQNGVSLLGPIAIENRSDEPLEQVELQIDASPAFALPFSRHIDLIPAGQAVTLTRPRVLLDASFLASLTEKLTGSLTITVKNQEENLLTEHFETTVLAFDEWQGLGQHPELLAAFVTPNHPCLAPVIARAAELLGQWTGDTAFDGYQSQDPNRVLHQAGAIYAALKELAMTYVVPPASFERTGQRVRLCDTVLAQRMGTCLDLTLLYASCLEAVGLHPLLIAAEGHIFIGLWLEERMFPECVQDDVSLLRKRLASGINEIAVVETTCLTNDLSFDEARASGEQSLTAKPFECVIDVHRARISRIAPLPQRIASPTGIVLRQEAARETPTAPGKLEETVPIEPVQADPIIPKQVQWERKLLDLGMRNTLINLRLTRSQLPVLSGSLDELENVLSDGRDFTILPRPADWQPSEYSFETLTELGADGVIQAEFTNRRLRTVLTEAELGKRLKDLYRTARTSLEENGANTLYLALGMLRWYESKRSTRARYAPIILLPIEMVRRSAAQGYVIRLRDEEPQMNITLLEKLKQDFGLVIQGLDPLPTDDRGVDIRRVLTIVRKAVMDQPRWDVLETSSLGIFSFSQFVMWNDIRSRTGDLMANKIVRSLIEGRLTWDAEPLELGERVPEDGVLLPMAADASQLHAIRAACSGRSFVLHGPPGTGKSQTITSLIANALAQGKRVLFVAEKMAALQVVRNRLEAIGIGPFCLELHSNKSKKKDVLEQLRRASEITRTQSAEEFARKAQQIAEARAELDAYARQLHRVQPCGSTLYTLINEYETCSGAPDLEPFDREFLRSLKKEDMERQGLLVERLISAARDVGHPKDHPLDAVRCSRYSQTLRSALAPTVEAFRLALNGITGPVRQLTAALGMEPPRCMEDVQQLFELAAGMACWYSLPASWTQAEQPELYFGQIRTLAAHGGRAETLKGQLLTAFDPGFLTLDAGQLRAEYAEISAKWFLPKLLGTNKLTRRLRTYAKSPITKDGLDTHIRTLEEYQREKAAADALLISLGAELGSYADNWDTLTRLADTALQSARALHTLWGSHELLRRHCGQPELKTCLTELCSRSTGFTEAHNALVSLLDLADTETEDWLASQQTLCTALLGNRDQLKEWTAYMAASGEVRSVGLSNLADAYAAGLSHEDAEPAWRKALLQGLIREAIDESDTLNWFSGAVFNRRIDQYKRMDREWTRLCQQEIYCRLAAKVPNFTREAAHSSELGILQRAIKSGGRGVSIRRLFDQIPGILSRLCPCVLMSPISAAQYLDPGREPFDIVVFDEASQMPTCKAVGVLARGRDAVIVGDPRQMPPTSFFSSNTLDEEDFESEDLESILDDCLALNMPQSHLLWHYRSRHESLIAFSNSQFYENKLYTFPSVSDRLSKVTLTQVDGVFDRGRTRTNRAEALAVLEEIRRRAADPVLSKQSMGVVTFNISQQHLIDDLLNEACAVDPALEKWAYGSEEPIFIKNLENVQGDERDVILFSVGFGPDQNGKLYLNFGPLNREGGWRRLNVAVTRARCEMKVFSTLRPDQLDLNRTGSEGVAALRRFLEYAGGRALALDEHQVRPRSADGIAEAIRDALKDAGYDADLCVGRSEYRIDLAVIDPREPEKYLLGILLDGPAYGAAKTTRDRELAQISVLKGLGWNILRVWTMDWWDNREKELARILAALKEHYAGNQEQEAPLPEPIAQPTERAVPNIPTPPLYREAVLPQTNLTAEEFLEPGNRALVQTKIADVIRTEAPVSIPLLTRRVIQSCGITRAGSRIQAHLDSILRSMNLNLTQQQELTFCWRREQVPETYLTYRVSETGDSRRDARDIPVQEAANAVCAVLQEQISMSTEDLIRETACQLGYTRLGSNVTAAMQQAIDYTRAAGFITTGPNGLMALTPEGTARAEAALRLFAGE